MQGHVKIVESLNEILTAELTAINQYYIHYKMCENWGYHRLAAQKRGEAMEEMKHADSVIERILFLDGIPNMQRYGSVKIGENVVEQHQLDLDLEYAAVKRLNDAMGLCRQAGDNGTLELLEHLLEDEEAAVDWLETQFSLLRDIGKERYLAENMHA